MTERFPILPHEDTGNGEDSDDHDTRNNTGPGLQPEIPERYSTGKFQIDYTGTLSEEIEWQPGHFRTVTNLADLRSRFKISSSSKQRKRDQIETQGELMLFKRGLDLNSLFSTEFRMPHYESIQNSKTGRVDITIFDREIMEDVRKKNDGGIDKPGFIDDLNSTVKDAVNSAIVWEKGVQLKENGPLATATFLYYSTILCTALISGHSIQRAQSGAFLLHGELPVALTVAGMLALTIAIEAINIEETSFPLFFHPFSKTPYMQSGKDYILPKHVIDMTKGIVYMATKGRKVVKQK